MLALSFKTASGWYGQLLVSSNTASGVYWRTATSLSGGWNRLLDTTDIKDATANAALTSSGTKLVTERAVYYGLVSVNGSSQSRATGIYAPTSAGTNG